MLKLWILTQMEGRFLYSQNNLLKNLSATFKSLYITFFLVFLLSFIQRLQIYLYHASFIDILKIHALFLTLLTLFSGLVALIFSLICFLLRLKPLQSKWLLNCFCSMTFIYFYVYTFLALDKSSFLLNRLWATGIGPVFLFLLIIFLCKKYSEKTNLLIDKIKEKLWPFLRILTIICFIGTLILSVLFLHKKHTMSGKQSLSSMIDTSINKPNIILISFDALTIKDMSLYGYHRQTTPFLEEFAKESYVFDNMYSNFVSTTSSVVSMFTSKYPWTHNVFLSGEYLKKGRDESLFSELDEYQIACAIGAYYANPIMVGLNTGKVKIMNESFLAKLLSSLDYFLYQFCHNTIPVNELPIFANIIPSRESDRNLLIQHPQDNYSYVLDSAKSFSTGLSFIKKMKDNPFFLWIHSFPPNPHIGDPYATNPPEPFLYSFTNKNDTIAKEVFVNGRYAKSFQDDVNKMRGRYNESILYADHCFNQFMISLKKMDLYDNSIIIVTSDHGESHEKGWRGHSSACLYNATTNIPLLIHLPGQTHGKKISSPAELIDIAPSILNIIGKPIPSHMQGESLLPYMLDTNKITTKPKYSVWRNLRNKFSEKFKIAVIADGYKLIYNMYTKQAQLFSLKDKDETNNLIKSHKSIANVLLKKIPVK